MLVFRTMSEDPATAVIAGRSEGVNRALETVENVRYSAQGDLKRFVVGVAADLTGFHCFLHGTRTPAIKKRYA